MRQAHGGRTALAVLLAIAGAAAGQEAHQHEPLTVDPALDWPALIDTTLAAQDRKSTRLNSSH